jgi:hypothetical protein
MELYRCAIFCEHSLKVIIAFCLNMSWYSVQIYLSYRVRYHLMNLHLPSSWELHASPPLRILIRISGWESVKGEGCDTPGVYFVLCREIYPNLGCSVKISISRLYLSPFIKLLMNVSPNLELFDLKNNQIWSLLKLFFSRSKCKFESQSRLATPVQTLLFGLLTVVMLSELCPNLHSPAEYLLCQPLIIFMQISLLSLCHHSSLFIKCILKNSRSLRQYSHEKINLIHAWNCSSEQMQILKFNKILSSCSNNSISTLQQKLLRVHAKEMSRKYPNCLKI